jgi:hypothetical protein
MAENKTPVVFCDIGDILGTPVFSAPPERLEDLNVFPFVIDVLKGLREDNQRLGIISNTGTEKSAAINEVLKSSDLLELFDGELLIYSSEVGLTKNSPEIFRLAAEKAGLADQPDNCMFVGENPAERSFAAQAGFRVARDLSLLGNNIFSDADFGAPDISNLTGCIEDARLAALESDPGPEDPTDYPLLLGRLETSRLKLPPLYRGTVFQPFVTRLNQIGQSGFNKILLNDPTRERLGGMMLDIAHSILQNGESFNSKATDAFEEVVSDLYDGFLSAQDRQGIKAPDHAILPPLVKWGNPDFGPYTWPVDATNQGFDLEAAVVSLPPANAARGLIAWAALGHETAGHDILAADDGLQPELAKLIQKELTMRHVGFGLADYWSTRIDETASDVMGILNMGPAAGIGLIAYFRGLNAAFTGNPILRSQGPGNDSHPADILRGYLAAATVRLLSFDQASNWANVIESETEKDVGIIRLNGIVVSRTVARQSAEIVAGVLATRKSAILSNHALIEIQDWRNRDEVIVAQLREVLTTTTPLTVELAQGVFAAHVVSAAVMAALSEGANIPILFSRMIAILKIMHDKNPSWGPLFITHPSNVRRDLSYTPHPKSSIVQLDNVTLSSMD